MVRNHSRGGVEADVQGMQLPTHFLDPSLDKDQVLSGVFGFTYVTIQTLHNQDFDLFEL